jgi:hypothetical protein
MLIVWVKPSLITIIYFRVVLNQNIRSLQTSSLSCLNSLFYCAESLHCPVHFFLPLPFLSAVSESLLRRSKWNWVYRKGHETGADPLLFNKVTGSSLQAKHSNKNKAKKRKEKEKRSFSFAYEVSIPVCTSTALCDCNWLTVLLFLFLHFFSINEEPAFLRRIPRAKDYIYNCLRTIYQLIYLRPKPIHVFFRPADSHYPVSVNPFISWVNQNGLISSEILIIQPYSPPALYACCVSNRLTQLLLIKRYSSKAATGVS